MKATSSVAVRRRMRSSRSTPTARGFVGELREGAGQISRVVCLFQCDDPVGLRPDQPPPPRMVFHEAGVKAGGQAEVEGEQANAGADAAGSDVMGFREDRRTGERTYYHRLSGDASGKFGALFASGGAKGKMEGIAEIRVDRDGKPLELTLKSSRAYAGKLQFAPEVKIDAETKARLARASGSVGQQFDYEASLLLDSPEKLRIAEQFLRAKSRDHFGLASIHRSADSRPSEPQARMTS